MIKTVYGLCVDDLFFYEGNMFRVESFPTRSMVIGDLVKEFITPAPYNIKIPFRKIDMPTVKEIKRMALKSVHTW